MFGIKRFFERATQRNIEEVERLKEKNRKARERMEAIKSSVGSGKEFEESPTNPEEATNNNPEERSSQPANDFAVDEENNVVYVSSDAGIKSFGL